MSSGRLTQRGRVFQSRVFAPRALAGGVSVIATDPNTGWIATKKMRLWVSESVSRIAIIEPVKRVWKVNE